MGNILVLVLHTKITINESFRKKMKKGREFLVHFLLNSRWSDHDKEVERV